MGALGNADAAKALINLQLGWPSPRLFAAEGLLSGAKAVLTSPEEVAAALVYGPHVGHPPLRQSVAEWLTELYQPSAGAVTQERVAISNGASANLANVLARFTDPLYTRQIFMVEPTYFLACPIFEDHGFHGKMRGVPENDAGIDVAYLRRELEKTEASAPPEDNPRMKTGANYPNKIYKYVIYCTPTFANPSGKTYSADNRQDLVRLAREYDALVVSDDVYDFLSWPADEKTSEKTHSGVAPLPPRLVDVDRELEGGDKEWGHTMSNGSFSKIIGPGVRVGWAEGTPAFVKNLGEVGSSSSGGAPSHLASTFVDKMLRSRYLQDYIQHTLIPTYQGRYYVMIAAIERLLVPLGVTMENNKSAHSTPATAGGFFLYIRLPADLPVAKTVAAIALRDYALRVAFGHMFVVAGDAGSMARAEAETGGGYSRCMRLCWAWHEQEAIQEGVERLAEAIVEIRRKIQAGEDVGSNLAIGIR